MFSGGRERVHWEQNGLKSKINANDFISTSICGFKHINRFKH